MAVDPFDNLITVINTVRTRYGDELYTLLPLGGQVAANSNAKSQQMVNTAWRALQAFLVSIGCVLLKPPPVVISGFGAMPSPIPGTEVYVSWSEYFDGTTHNPSLVLPQDLIEPIEVQERSSGFNGSFLRMDLIIGSMPGVPQTAWNGSWQWRQNKLVMVGTTAAFDLRVDYAGYFADFLDTGDVTTAVDFTPWYEQPVPILRSLNTFADYICAEIERARGNKDAAMAYITSAEDGARIIADPDYGREKSTQNASEFAKMKDMYTPGNTPVAPGVGQ